MKENNLKTEGTETRGKDSFDERLVLAYTVLRQNSIGNHRWAFFHSSSLLTRACLYGHQYYPSPLLIHAYLYGHRYHLSSLLPRACLYGHRYHLSLLLTHACLYGHQYHPSPLLKPPCLYGAWSSDRTATFCPSFLNG